MDPYLLVKREGEDEINVESITPRLHFLGLDNNVTLTNNYTDLSGIDGSLYNFSSYGKSTTNAKFLLEFGDIYDFKLARHDIYKFFLQKKLYRVRSHEYPAKVQYVRPVNFDLNIDQDGAKYSTFTIPFENPSGYMYSLYPCNLLYTYDVGGWQIGMNLPNGQDLDYRFQNLTKFKMYNASDIEIDPYFQRHELKLIIKHVGKDPFTITNLTTNTSFKFTGTMNEGDTLIVDGVNAYLNNNLVDDLTTYTYLTLAPGWNDFSVDGALDLDITFNYHFIYLA